MQVTVPAQLLMWERMWEGKNNRREDIPDSIDAILTEQIDNGAYANIYTMHTSNPDDHYSYFTGILWKVHLNLSKSEDLLEKYNGPW